MVVVFTVTSRLFQRKNSTLPYSVVFIIAWWKRIESPESCLAICHPRNSCLKTSFFKKSWRQNNQMEFLPVSLKSWSIFLIFILQILIRLFLIINKYFEIAKTANGRPIFEKCNRTKVKIYRPVGLYSQKFRKDFYLTNGIDRFLSKFISVYWKSCSSNFILIVKRILFYTAWPYYKDACLRWTHLYSFIHI